MLTAVRLAALPALAALDFNLLARWAWGAGGGGGESGGEAGDGGGK